MGILVVNLHHTDERRGDVRPGNADFGEAADAVSLSEEEFLDSFGEKNPADKNAQQQCGPGMAEGNGIVSSQDHHLLTQSTRSRRGS